MKNYAIIAATFIGIIGLFAFTDWLSTTFLADYISLAIIAGLVAIGVGIVAKDLRNGR